MNRKGDVPTILLFVFAIVLAVTALFVFVSFPNDFSNNSKEVNKMLNEVDFNERYVMANAESIVHESVTVGKGDVKTAFKNIADSRYLGYQGAGNFFAKVRSDEFELSTEEGNYVLRINGLFVHSDRGFNSMKRNFNLEMKFNNAGKRVD